MSHPITAVRHATKAAQLGDPQAAVLVVRAPLTMADRRRRREKIRAGVMRLAFKSAQPWTWTAASLAKFEEIARTVQRDLNRERNLRAAPRTRTVCRVLRVAGGRARRSRRVHRARATKPAASGDPEPEPPSLRRASAGGAS